MRRHRTYNPEGMIRLRDETREELANAKRILPTLEGAEKEDMEKLIKILDHDLNSSISGLEDMCKDMSERWEAYQIRKSNLGRIKCGCSN